MINFNFTGTKKHSEVNQSLSLMTQIIEEEEPNENKKTMQELVVEYFRMCAEVKDQFEEDRLKANKETVKMRQMIAAETENGAMKAGKIKFKTQVLKPELIAKKAKLFEQEKLLKSLGWIQDRNSEMQLQMIDDFNDLLASNIENQIQRTSCPCLNLKEPHITETAENLCDELRDYEWPNPDHYSGLTFEEAEKLQVCGVSNLKDRFQFIMTNEWMSELKVKGAIKDNFIPDGSTIRSIQICCE